MPKNQSTASKKARAAQATAGGEHTTHLRNVTRCGNALDPWGAFPATSARAPHPADEPHSEDRDFDVMAECFDREGTLVATGNVRWRLGPVRLKAG